MVVRLTRRLWMKIASQASRTDSSIFKTVVELCLGRLHNLRITLLPFDAVVAAVAAAGGVVEMSWMLMG
jgi:hypothetical protein